MNRFRKALVAVGGLLAEIIALGVLNGDAQAWTQVALAAATAALVYLVPNTAPAAPPQ